MPRFLLSVPLLLLVGTAAAFLTHPAAQVAAPLLIGAAPGIGHGFLIDKHVAAGLELRGLPCGKPSCQPARILWCVQNATYLFSARGQNRCRRAESARLASRRNFLHELSPRSSGFGDLLCPVPQLRHEHAISTGVE